MTYLTEPRGTRRIPRSRARQRYGKPMGGLFFDVVDTLISGPAIPLNRKFNCIGEAEAGLGPINAQIDEAKRWQPTGFFTPDDVGKILSTVLEASSRAGSELVNAPNADDVDDIINELSTAQNSAQVYMKARLDAVQQGARVINAPGLKGWVIDSLEAIKSATRKTVFLNCDMSWFQIAVRKINEIVDVVLAVLRVIVGVVLSAGEAVVDAIDFSFQLLKFAKIAILFGGGFYLFTKVKEMRARRP